MELFHAALLSGQERSQTAGLTALTSAIKAEEYVVVGIHPRLAPSAHQVFHELARALQAQSPSISHAMAFTQLMVRLQQADCAYKWTERTAHFLALAAAYGVRFATVDDAVDAINGLHLLFAPVFTGKNNDTQHQGFWTQLGNFFAVVGDGLEKKRQLHVQETLWLATAISATHGAVRICDLLGIHTRAQQAGVDPDKLLALLVIAPRRAHEIGALLVEEVLVNAAVDELVECPQLYLALTLPALRSLLGIWEPGEDLSEIARVFANDLQDLNTHPSRNE